MDLLPRVSEEYMQKDYWQKYENRINNQVNQYYGEFNELSSYISKYIHVRDNILVTGCANTIIGVDFLNSGYNVVIIDSSKNVVTKMSEKYPEVKFQHMSLQNMKFNDMEFSVVFDKGVLDSLMTDAGHLKQNINKYFAEVSRILKFGGRFFCVSLLQKHILLQVLLYFKTGWALRLMQIYEVQNMSSPLFLLVCTKFRNFGDSILEVGLNGNNSNYIRYKNIEKMLSLVEYAQKIEISFNYLYEKEQLKREMKFDLLHPIHETVRYSIIVNVTDKFRSFYGEMAIFIVPVGREKDWMFSTEEGRYQLLQKCQCNRMAFVFLQKNIEYGTMDDIEKELNINIYPIYPIKKRIKIPIMTLKPDEDDNNIVFKGSSEFSGPFVISDLQISEYKYRRLIFLNRPFVIQSEIKLLKQDEKLENEICSIHDVQICSAIGFFCNEKANIICDVLIIGLGGGISAKFLLEKVTNINLTMVEIDSEMVNVAKNWFGLDINHSRLKIVIDDGIKFLKECVKNRMKYHIILFDVDSKDVSSAVSCPPKEFIEDLTLDETHQCLKKNGMFMLNLTCRDSSIRDGILERFKQKFGTVCSIKSNENINDILLCSQRYFQKKKSQFKNQLVNFSEKVCGSKLNEDISMAFNHLQFQ